MNYHNNVNDLGLLKSFSHIKKTNGNYIGNKNFNRYIKSSKEINNALFSSPGENIKDEYNALCKKIHEYRIEKLCSFSEYNLYSLFQCISSANIVINSKLIFRVSSIQNLLDKLKFFTENKLDSYVQNIIKDSFKDYLEKEIYLSINIDNNKIREISNNDLHVILKKLVIQVQQPAEIKYFSNTIKELEVKELEVKELEVQNIFSTKQTEFYTKELENKVILGIEQLLNYREKNSYYNPQEILYKMHSFICLVSYQKINLQAKIKKKLTDEIMFLFNEFIRNITLNISDLKIINKQSENANIFIDYIVKVLINFIAKHPEKFITDINKLQLKLTDKTNSILEQAELSFYSLLYYLDTIDNSIANLLNIIETLIENNLNIENIIDQKKQIEIKKHAGFSTTIKQRKLAVLIQQEQKADIDLTNDINKFKKEINSVITVYSSYDQECVIFKKHINDYKHSIDSKKSESYQKCIVGNLISYLTDKLYTSIIKNRKYLDSTDLKQNIDTMLNLQKTESGKIAMLAIMYKARDISAAGIILDINKFVEHIKELQQQDTLSKILNEYTLYQ